MNTTVAGQWRFGLPVTALLLVLLAVPLSFVNPRSGRSFHLVVALLIYAIYNNVLSISHAWVIQGKLSPWVGVWSVHVAMGLLITVLYQRRIGVGWKWAWWRR
jgi:lipopolysaccharide export system permease protein